MKTLILCVDRDDDLGQKVGVISPIVGRKDNLRAAIALALKDPEDSDVNSIFAALQEYDLKANENQDVEIATICGDKEVGTRSDQILAAQLESVLREVEPDSLIFISDGAEDEFIKPLIYPRVKVDAVRRVIVRQQKDIESTFYIISNALKDEKVLKRIGIPIIVALFIWSLFSIISLTIGFIQGIALPDYGLPAVMMAMALYIFVKIFKLEKTFTAVGKDIKLSLERGRYIQIFTAIVALVVGGYGFFMQGLWPIIDADLPESEFFITLAEKSMWYILGGILIYGIGKAMDLYYRKGLAFRPLPTIVFSVFGIGFIMRAILDIAGFLLLDEPIETGDIQMITILVLIGFAFLVITVWIHTYIKERYISRPVSPGWRR